MSDYAPPVAFHFSVSFAGSQAVALACQSVSGLEATLDAETIVEGGENRFVHQLPKPASHPNLTFERGLATGDSEIMTWCKSVLEHNFATPITVRDLTVSLLDQKGTAVAQWQVENAYPVKLAVGDLDAMQSKIVIETIEIAYHTVTRTL